MIAELEPTYDNVPDNLPSLFDVLEPPYQSLLVKQSYKPGAEQKREAYAKRVYECAIWYNQYKNEDGIFQVRRQEPVKPILHVAYDGKNRPTGYFMGGGTICQELGRISGAKEWLEKLKTSGVRQLPEDCNDLWLLPNLYLARYHFLYGGENSLGGEVEYTYYDAESDQFYVTNYCQRQPLDTLDKSA